MDMGYGKNTLVVEVDVNEDTLLAQLMKVKNLAGDLFHEANNLIRQLQQVKKEAGTEPSQPED